MPSVPSSEKFAAHGTTLRRTVLQGNEYARSEGLVRLDVIAIEETSAGAEQPSRQGVVRTH